MSTTKRAAAVVVSAAAVIPFLTTPAVAVPQQKGATTVAPSPLTASVLQGLTGPARLGPDGAVFGIVGGDKNGVIKHVGGLVVAELDPATTATSLTLSNFWIDTRAATVSAVVNDGARATVFAVGAGGVLTFTSTASAAVTGSPTAIAGLAAGVATVSAA